MILHPYLRRVTGRRELTPWFYVEQISFGDCREALPVFFGADSPGLSVTTVVRLKNVSEEECLDWSKRSLPDKQYVYIRVDGIHFNIHVDDDRHCILVVMGATEDGKKELIAVHDGYQESEQVWKGGCLHLTARGLDRDLSVASDDWYWDSRRRYTKSGPLREVNDGR